MKKARIAVLVTVVVLLSVANVALADTFGTGGNQFTIDFVDISGDSGDLGSWSAGFRYTFSGVNHGDYRMGKFEITNDQWNKFKNEYGTVTGSPPYAYDESPRFTGTDIPTNELSWYEGAQFVNWLNTSTGHQAAYKFTGTQGTGDYTFALWQPEDLGYDSDNPYRNSKAFYFMPTEDEWVKAAYWNGTSLQTYATIGDLVPVAGVDTNYDFAVGHQPWDVGSGSEELNGTFDMMGNVWEWMESPDRGGDYLPGYLRGERGGAYGPDWYEYFDFESLLASSYSSGSDPFFQGSGLGFRVASVPVPAIIQVSVDVKPGSCPNPLRVNFRGKGMLPVAILGSEDFNVFDIDIATITLEGVAPVRSSFEDVSTPFDGEECECSTEGADGIFDLVLKFRRADILAALEDTYGDLAELPHRTELPLTLTAKLMDEGPELEGTDCLTVLNRGAIKRKK